MMWYIKKIGCGQSFEGIYIALKSSNSVNLCLHRVEEYPNL